MSIIDAAIKELKEGREKGYKPNYVRYINENNEVIELIESA